jgi:hypothetical protein
MSSQSHFAYSGLSVLYPLDVTVCQVVPNGEEDYRRCGERIRVSR